MLKRLSIALILTNFLFSACSGASETELKTVQEQQVGEYTVTVKSETGTIKKGTGDFVLEFRKTADNQLVDVSPVEVAPIMEMPGMGPMMGTTTIKATDKPGIYHVTSSLSMAGLWKFNVQFGSGEAARININAE